MLRRHTPLLTLTLLAAFCLAAPRAEAINFVLIPNSTPLNCEATVTATVSCSQTITFSPSPGQDLGDDLANSFEIKTTVTQGTWDISIFVEDDDGDAATAGFTGMNGIDMNNDGVLYLSYSAFTGSPNPIDFDKIREVGLTVANQSAIGDEIQVGQLTSVPEPGTASLMTLGLIGLAVASPRRRIAA